MNNVTLAHIGGEIVLIGGVAFYFHRKTKNLGEQIVTLQKENAELREAIQDLSEQIQQLGNMVMQMRHSHIQTKPTQVQQKPTVQVKQVPKKVSVQQPPLQTSKIETFSQIEEDDLDKEISEELEELQKGREQNCDEDGVCKLVDE